MERNHSPAAITAFLEVRITVNAERGTWRMFTGIADLGTKFPLTDTEQYPGHELRKLRDRIAYEMWSLLALEEQRARARGTLPPV